MRTCPKLVPYHRAGAPREQVTRIVSGSARRARSGLEDPVPQPGVPYDAASGVEPVTPPDLLAFGVGPSRVTDAYLIDPPATLGDFGRDLRFEAESVLPQGEILNHLPPKRLITGF